MLQVDKWRSLSFCFENINTFQYQSNNSQLPGWHYPAWSYTWSYEISKTNQECHIVQLVKLRNVIGLALDDISFAIADSYCVGKSSRHSDGFLRKSFQFNTNCDLSISYLNRITMLHTSAGLSGSGQNIHSSLLVIYMFLPFCIERIVTLSFCSLFITIQHKTQSNKTSLG